jgi:hypothetical protein
MHPPLNAALTCCVGWRSKPLESALIAALRFWVQVDSPQAPAATCNGECDYGYRWGQLHGVTLEHKCQGDKQPKEFRRGCRLLLQDAREVLAAQ